MEERLQKILSSAGLCSRRTAEAWLAAGRVTVNGAPAKIGDKADLSRDTVLADGVPVRPPEALLYLMLNKPRGVVTTLSDEKGRKTVSDLVSGCGGRVWPVGRLDYDSEGLLILTNDGALTHRLTHPGCGVEKEYHVLVTGDVAPALPLLRAPMVIDGERMGPARVSVLERGEGKTLLSVVIHEGKNRQVRRMCAHTGLSVASLRRVREGGLRLDGALESGRWRPLTAAERELLAPRATRARAAAERNQICKK